MLTTVRVRFFRSHNKKYGKNLGGEEMEEVKIELTFEEVKKKILAGERDFRGAIIKGGLNLLNLRGATIKDSLGLDFRKATIHGHMDITEATISGDLDFAGAIIEGGLSLKKATIKGELDFEGAIIKGHLDLIGTTIEGNLYLSTKEGPTTIYVRKEMAQLVHWSAPRISLVIEQH